MSAIWRTSIPVCICRIELDSNVSEIARNARCSRYRRIDWTCQDLLKPTEPKMERDD